MKINTDGLKLAQITMNLLENSLNNIKKGYIILRASLVKRFIDIIRIDIIDTGDGIESEQKAE